MLSLPVQGAWIEMERTANDQILQNRRSPCRERGLKFAFISLSNVPATSLPVQGAWIEIVASQQGFAPAGSLPVQGAWIEIFKVVFMMILLFVAPRAGSVD